MSHGLTPNTALPILPRSTPCFGIRGFATLAKPAASQVIVDFTITYNSYDAHKTHAMRITP